MSDHKSKPSQKKSETIEFRLSFEEKAELQARAKGENRSVSNVLRRLIHNYLEQDVKPHDSHSNTFLKQSSEMIMRIKKNLRRRPKALIALGATMLGTLALLMPAAYAQEIGLDVNGEFVHKLEEGTRTQRFDFEALVDYDETLKLDVGQRMNDTLNGFTIEIIATDRQDGDVLLSIRIYDERKKNDRRLIASPTLITKFGKRAEIKIGDGQSSYSISLNPKRID